jgi:hypothetical protein
MEPQRTQPKKIPRAGEVQCRRNPFGGFKDCDGAQTNGMIVAAASWDDQVNSDLGHSESVLNATGGTGEKFCPNPVIGLAGDLVATLVATPFVLGPHRANNVQAS